YQALLAKDQALFDQLKTALAGDDLGKLYDTLKSIIATHEGKDLMIAPVKHAIGQILAATTNASNALMQQLSAQTQTLIGHVHSAAFLRYAGQQVTQVVVSLRLGEYLSLLNEAMQERTDQFITQLDQKFRKPAERKIRAMVVSGAIAIAVSGNHGKLVDVMLWSLESAQDLQARLEKLRANASTNVTEALRSVSIGAATLHSGSTRLLHTLAISMDDAQALARGAMQRMRNTAISAAPAGANLLLGLGSLWFQQDSLRKNFETFLNTPGSGNPEALAAVWSSSIGVMGVGVEIAGVGTQLLRPGLTTTVRVAGQVQTVMMGARIAQYGGAIAAIAGVMDGVQYSFAATRARTQGDHDAATKYTYATFLSLGGAVAGAWGALAIESILLGPIGVAIICGLAAYAVATYAKKNESSPLELWARHSKWGKPFEFSRWKSSLDFNTAVGELNASVLGVTADLSINLRPVRESDIRASGEDYAAYAEIRPVPYGYFLEYKFSLPGYDSASSSYAWSMKVYRPGLDEQIIVSGNNGSPAAATESRHSLKRTDYKTETTRPSISFSEVTSTLVVSGAIWLYDIHGIHAADLEVSFWPDRNDESGVARILALEDKVDCKRNKQ
ncbi:T6SS effector BTH_I2691 family protein, partial [Pseudomonas sp. QD4]|uniref:T6SS effector BTH_I2691 family protein n=1 Tax=Pseudomonas sp. QD4 TaxID=3368618 RepID=UPI003B9F5BB9